MITAHCQRWRDGASTFRPAGERFDPTRHEVVILTERDAKDFCTRHHYSASMPAARFRVGLLRKAPNEPLRLAGVAVFSVPMQPAVLTKHLKADVHTGAELGRFVLEETVEGNGESWFLAAANRLLARETPIRAVVSYADPVARIGVDGTVIKPGHIGTIYQAMNARMIGWSSARTLVLTRSGQVISGRALSKIRKGECGADYAYRQLLAAGAPHRRLGEDAESYVRRALSEGPFVRRRHPGNLVYAYAVGDAAERRAINARLPPGVPYPKARDLDFPAITIGAE